MPRMCSKLRCLGNVIVMLALFMWIVTPAIAQNPTGTINGTVKDPSGAVIAGASVTATNTATGASRNLTTENLGTFRFDNMRPGEYQVKAEAPGFASQTQTLIVRVGSVTTSNFSLTIGQPSEVIEVTGEAQLVSTTESVLNSSFSQSQIDELPINGRSFLSVASLDPSAQLSYMIGTSSIPTFNSSTRIAIASPFTGELANVQANIQVDGIRVNDRRVGNTAQNFSADTVQEFQLNTLSFDLSAGTSASGIVNTVTRSGTNDFHGAAYIYYRDNNIAAYPGYARDPADPDPYFTRKHIGFTLSGPISKDKLMFFANYERNNQVGARSIEFTDPLVHNFNHVGRLPTNGNLGSIRLDWQASTNHNAFLRYSVDQNITGVGPNYLESYWQNVDNYANQIVTGVTSVLKPTLVNDFRFGFSYFSMIIDSFTREECERAAGNPGFCVGSGGPRIAFIGGLTIGTHNYLPENYYQRNWQFTDNVKWIKGSHSISFGGTWDPMNHHGRFNNCQFGCFSAYSPTALLAQAPDLYDALPPSLRGVPGTVVTIPDLMQLPVSGSVSTQVGDSYLPTSYRRDEAKKNHDFRLYFQDGWQVREGFTLNYGLAWSAGTAAPIYHMLPLPQYMSAFRSDLGVVPNDWSNWDASLGIAWSPGGDRKTVIRSSISNHMASQNRLINKWDDLRYKSPAGSGLFVASSTSIANPKAGQPGQPATLSFPSPADFTVQEMVDYFPTVKAQLEDRFAGYDGMDFSVTNLDVTKSGGPLYDKGVRNPYSVQFSVGVQREIATNLGISVDYIMIRSVKFGAADVTSYDVNQWNRFSDYTISPTSGRASPIRNPVLPACTPAQAGDPLALCSTGSIRIGLSNRNGRYSSLQFKLDRRFSGGFQFSATYAYTQTTQLNGIIDHNDINAAYGISTNPKNKFTANATWDVPRYDGDNKLLRGLANGWQLSTIVQGLSARARDPRIGSYDTNGDGIRYMRLPGMDINTFGWSVDNDELRRLVDNYNATVPAAADVALKDIPRSQRDARGNAYPYIVLPDDFSNNDSFWTADLRLSRTIPFGEAVSLRIIAEGFNILNISNVIGYSQNLDAMVRPSVTGGTPTLPPRGLLFGQPTSRTQSVFGSGGPRAFQLAARLTF